MGNNSSSSSSSRTQWKYGVCLSFIRPEVDAYDHHFFTANLLAALDANDVKTFYHSHQPTQGQQISQEVAQRIRESNVAFVILTREYATSAWCLDELVEIIECRKTLGQIVIPIFFDVDPSDVRKQTGNFDDQVLARHAQVPDKIWKWKAALNKAADIVGCDLRVNRPDRIHIDQFVKKDILPVLGHKLEDLPSASGTPPPYANPHRRIESYSTNWLVLLYVLLRLLSS